ncbi:MAG: thioredoxin family protein [Bacteroidaceae bacterium]|nr:thioredoxin family protein [Bacteroidaceae bacterium]
MKRLLTLVFALLAAFGITVPQASAQQGPSTYEWAEAYRQEVKMKYVYSLEEALKLAKKSKKPIFVNCFEDWAVPCHLGNHYFFSDETLCRWMDENFVCLWLNTRAPENMPFREKYRVGAMSCYIVLDRFGEVMQIYRGFNNLPTDSTKMPEAFMNNMKLALSEETSLRGTAKKYNAGDHSKEMTFKYLKAIEAAGEDSLINAMRPVYFEMLSPEEYALEENWSTVRHYARDVNSPVFKYITENRETFDKNIGQQKVDDVLASGFVSELMPYVMGEKAYDSKHVFDTYLAMNKADIAEDNACFLIYDIVKAHGEHKYAETIENLKKLDPRYKPMIDMSLKFPDRTPEETKMLTEYFKTRQMEYGSEKNSYFRAYRDMVENLNRTGGIKFETGTLETVLAKAKAEGKMVFVDCYTTWCGPCKMLAKQTFTDATVGDYYNDRFVSIQIDMEHGEGPELAKRYGVSAYPTLIYLDSNGNLITKQVGFRHPVEFLAETKRLMSEAGK